MVIVDEADDAFGETFTDWARVSCVRALRWRLDEAAMAFSITTEGQRTSVEPALPMFLRPLRGVQPPGLADDRFMWGERFAALWSAAALTELPVVNRPNEWGWAGRAAISAVVTDRRAGNSVTPPESLWHGTAPDNGFGYHQDLVTWQALHDPSSVSFGRSRSLRAMRGWDRVITVGEHAFRVTIPEVHNECIEESSVRTVAALGLTFATVNWGFPIDGSRPLITKINPFPTLYECMPVLEDVFAALLRELLG